MLKRKSVASIETCGGVELGVGPGLSTLMAQRIRDRVSRFDARVTIDNGRGQRADAKSLIELLLLGAKQGDNLEVRCAGPDAPSAYAAVASVLCSEGATT